jgi:hypothetical protein
MDNTLELLERNLLTTASGIPHRDQDRAHIGLARNLACVDQVMAESAFPAPAQRTFLTQLVVAQLKACDHICSRIRLRLALVPDDQIKVFVCEPTAESLTDDLRTFSFYQRGSTSSFCGWLVSFWPKPLCE